jgi:hypothetical protein
VEGEHWLCLPNRLFSKIQWNNKQIMLPGFGMLERARSPVRSKQTAWDEKAQSDFWLRKRQTTYIDSYGSAPSEGEEVGAGGEPKDQSSSIAVI